MKCHVIILTSLLWWSKFSPYSSIFVEAHYQPNLMVRNCHNKCDMLHFSVISVTQSFMFSITKYLNVYFYEVGVEIITCNSIVWSMTGILNFESHAFFDGCLVDLLVFRSLAQNPTLLQSLFGVANINSHMQSTWHTLQYRSLAGRLTSAVPTPVIVSKSSFDHLFLQFWVEFNCVEYVAFMISSTYQ